MPGIISRRRVGNATNANLHEKYVAKAIPDMNDDDCIKNKGTCAKSILKG